MKIVLVGYGHLGKWHAEKLNTLYGQDFVAIVELDRTKHSLIKEKFPNVSIYSNLDEVIDQVDAVVIATPTTFHFSLIEKTLSEKKHCFVEKPMTSNLKESLRVGELLNGENHVFQVGHSERFHHFWPTLLNQENFKNVKIARFDRIAPYKGRGDDVDIIYDLMIHDYDLLTMLGFDLPIELEAWGTSCHTKMIDYCTSKITYADKVVFVTASRSSVKEKRGAEFVFEDGVLEVDLMNSEVSRSYKDKDRDTLAIKYEKKDHLLEEHKLFKHSIERQKNNEVSYEVGHLAMKLMDLTVRSIRENRVISWE